MEKNIATINNIGDEIRNKIRKTIIEAIPEELIDETIKFEVKRFIEEDLPNIIKKEMDESAKEFIKGYLCHSSFNKLWNEEANDFFVSNLAMKMAPSLVTGFMAQIAQKTIEDMHNQTGTRW